MVHGVMEVNLPKLSLTGDVLTKFYSNERPGKRVFRIHLDTLQIVWRALSSKAHTEGAIEGLVDIRTIKEVRLDKNSKDFEKSPEDARQYERTKCFVVHYGTKFRLATISCAADSDEVAKHWVTAIEYLMQESDSASSIVRVHRINLADLVSIVDRLNCRIPLPLLDEMFQAFCPTQTNLGQTKEISIKEFKNFISIYRQLVLVEEIFASYFLPYSTSRKYLTISEFHRFMTNEQGSNWTETDAAFVELADSLHQESNIEHHDVCLTMAEFLDYLFSNTNTIWNSSTGDAVVNMDQPLNHYWIASSHNTYLTGNALTSESAVEAYIRCLRMGCRCVELDTWDGPDGTPIIYHGNTLTSKIRFIDVIEAIKVHAFATSDYPVILSMEDHCSLPQQRVMAKLFTKVFGSMLVTKPIDEKETRMPSPEQFKRKIFIKHKRLSDKPKPKKPIDPKNPAADSSPEGETLKIAVLRLKDKLTQNWVPYNFVLSATELTYRNRSEPNENTQLAESSNVRVHPRNHADSHLTEVWFHGKLVNGQEAVNLLLEHSQLGVGSFLVRYSGTFPGEYSLSFIGLDEQVHHGRFKTELDREGNCMYYLTKQQVQFICLRDFIEHYRHDPLVYDDAGSAIRLGASVPQEESYIDRNWFNASINGEQANTMVQTVGRDGAFILRKSETSTGELAISFMAEQTVKHCKITREGQLFVLGSAPFGSLEELVDYYHRVPLYRRVKLKYAVTPELLQHARAISGTSLNHIGGPMEYVTMPRDCWARRNYTATSPTELSFRKDEIISNIRKDDGGWWRGDCNGKIGLRFPCHFVEEVSSVDYYHYRPSNEDTFVDPDQLGSFQLSGWTVTEIPKVNSEGKFVFQMSTRQNPEPVEIACESLQDMKDWVKDIGLAKKAAKLKLNDETKQKCARELSKIIVYFWAVAGKQFDDNLKNASPDFREMYSLSEMTFEKYARPARCKGLVKYNLKQFSRIYPRNERVDSSNYDPTRMWNHGCQLVALNYQTPDLPMHLNDGRFLENGRTGYVLQPKFLRTEGYNPCDPATHSDPVPLVIDVTVIAGRHFVKEIKGIVSPYVEVEVTGTSHDCKKYRTATVQNNGLNPSWHETYTFTIKSPELALIRFAVQDCDTFGIPQLVGQAVFPVRHIRSGYRSVPLKNGWNDELELSVLLVRVRLKSAVSQRLSLGATEVQGTVAESRV